MNMGRNTDDIKAWDKLADVHLSSYNLPSWEIPCSVDNMELWLDRANISKHLYEKRTSTTLTEFITLNPNWSYVPSLAFCWR